MTINDRPAHQGIETYRRGWYSEELQALPINDRPAHQGIETELFPKHPGLTLERYQ